MTQLTPLQQEALTRAKDKPGYGYFLEMGLGKSLLALAEFLHLVEDHHKATRLVVVSPNSFKSGWASEIRKHGLTLTVHVYEASKHEKALAFIGQTYQYPPVLILNYEAMRLPKVQELLNRFTERRRCYLALDESISLKNPTAKRTRAILKMVGWFQYVRLLSGRPSTQGPHDLWGQLTAIGALRPGENFYSFRGTYCKMGGWEGREVVGVQNEAGLIRRMAPFTMVAKKSEWLKDLPAKSYTTRTYELHGELGAQYASMEEEFLVWLRNQQGQVVDRVQAEIAIVKLTKLMQIHAGFVHDEEGEPHWLVPDDDNPRYQLLLELLEGMTSKACVCFKHRFVGDHLYLALERLGYKPARLAGGMSTGAIEHEKWLFNNDPECRLILLQTDASRYGHTLLGDQKNEEDRCHTMLFYQNDYSLDTRSQLEDRIHRIGQANACLYIDLVGSEMDARMIAALQHKRSMYEALFGR